MTLIQYLRKHRELQAEFARRACLGTGTVSRYCTGERVPARAEAVIIERYTRGAVTVESWARPTGRRKAGRVRKKNGRVRA